MTTPDNTIARPALRYYGSQFNNAPWIAEYMPTHNVRAIPFMGGLNDELRWQPVKVVNATDLDGRVTHFPRRLASIAIRSAAALNLYSVEPATNSVSNSSNGTAVNG